MRYLITIFVVLALVSPAMSECTTPGRELEVRSDCHLPDSSDQYSVIDCSEFTWEVEFYRNSDTTRPNVLINAFVVGSDMSEFYNSGNFRPDSTYTFGPFTGHINNGATSNQLRIARNCLACGKFEEIKLKVYHYVE